MYQEIENKFLRQSKVRKIKILLLFLTATVCIFESIVLLRHHSILLHVLGAIVGGLFCLLIAYIYSFFTVYKKGERKIAAFIKIAQTFSEYQKIINEHDQTLLQYLLKQYNITTKPRILEALRHYQCLLPKKISTGGKFFSLCAGIVPIIAFVFAEGGKYAKDYAQILLIILFLLGFGYFIYKIIENEWLKPLSKTAMYERLESTLSTLYFSASSSRKKDKQNTEN